MNKYFGAAVFGLATAIATPAAGVKSDGNICLYMVLQKHKALQGLWQETFDLEKLLKDSKECSEVDVNINIKGYYHQDSTGKLTCYRTDKPGAEGRSVAHEYSLGRIESVAVGDHNQVIVSFKDDETKGNIKTKIKAKIYTLPDTATVQKTWRAFQDVMNSYWTLKA